MSEGSTDSRKVTPGRTPRTASEFSGFLLLLPIFALALLLRLSAIHDKFLWFDEFLSANLARNPWPGILAAIRVEAHPPLYFLILKVWAIFFGDGAVAMKSLSLVCGMGAIIFLADAVRRAEGVVAAAVATILIGLSTVQIDQSTDAKPYAMLAFFLALLLWSIVRAARDGRGVFVGTAIAAAFAAGATHFYGVAAVLAIGVAALLAAKGVASRKRAGGILLVGAADALLWLPAAARLPRGAADYIREIWGHVPKFAPLAVSTRISLPGWRKPYPPMDATMLPQVSIREILAGLVVMILLAASTFRRRAVEQNGEEPRFLVAAGLMLFPGFLILETAAQMLDRPVGLPGRYEVVTEIGLALLAGGAAGRIGRPAWVFAALLGAAALWTTIPQWRPHFGGKPIRREALLIGDVRARLRPGESAEIVTLGLARPPLDYYAAGDSRIRMISFPASQNLHPGWRESSISNGEARALALEALVLAAHIDSDLERGISVYIAVRPDPRNDFLIPLLQKDHDWIRSRFADWFFLVAPAPERLAFSGNRFEAAVSFSPEEAIWDDDGYSWPDWSSRRRRLTGPWIASFR